MKNRPGPWSWVATLATFALFAITLTGTASGGSSGRAAASVGAASSTTNIPFAGSSYGVTGSTSPFGSWTPAAPYAINIVRYAFAQSGENL
jgi:CHASE2 domain-containing sensor protein